MDKNNILFPVIEYYLGCHIDHIEKNDDTIFFWSNRGTGELQQNVYGDWEVYMEGEKVEEIEDKVFQLILPSDSNSDPQSYYEELSNLLKENLAHRSRCLIKDIMASIELLVLDKRIIIKKPIEIRNSFIFMLDGKKQIVCLN
jgi:hypothetical protein